MSPGRVIVALYDRLLLDLDRAEHAITAKDHAASHDALVHAQEIVHALHDALDVTAWSAAPQLADLYLYVLGELVAANVSKEPARVAACRALVTPLRDAWSEAAGVAGTSSSASSASSARR